MLGGAAAGVVNLALAGKPFEAGAQQSRLPPLRIGVTATDLFAEAYYGADAGFFRKAGINAPHEEQREAAAVLTEPALTAGLKEGNLRSLGDPNPGVAPRYLASAWFTTRGFAAQNPDLMKRFSGAMYETARWTNRNHEASGAILAKYAKLKPEVIRSMIRAQFSERMDLPDMQALLDASLKYGFLQKPVDAADLIVRA